MRNKNKYLKKYKKNSLNIWKFRKGPYLCFINHNQKLKTMTIKEFVLNQKNQGINEWIELIKKNELSEFQDLIIQCADHFNKIIVNHSAQFENSIY